MLAMMLSLLLVWAAATFFVPIIVYPRGVPRGASRDEAPRRALKCLTDNSQFSESSAHHDR